MDELCNDVKGLLLLFNEIKYAVNKVQNQN